MAYTIARTCTDLTATGESAGTTKSLREFRSKGAYVLLGDPGSGKTTAFKEECADLKDEGHFLSARDFIALDPANHPEWRGKTLFIDGLDEIRAGAPDRRQPFDRVRSRLDQLGCPRFRLSCRGAGWLGQNDLRHLAAVSNDPNVALLQLNPLTDSDIERVLNNRLPASAEPFLTGVRKRGLERLLANPQTLEMLIGVFSKSERLPNTRLETFEQACQILAQETNEDHSASVHLSALERILHAAGRICAIQLISGCRGSSSLYEHASEDFPYVKAYENKEYELHLLQAALSTRLFTLQDQNRFVEIHRHVAEFLGARYLAKCIHQGTPSSRILALIIGDDGFVVTGYRGLSAWLAAHCPSVRQQLIERDPIGIISYGDISSFSIDEKRSLLSSLKAISNEIILELRRFRGFPFLSNSFEDSVFLEVFDDPSRRTDHQALVALVLRVLKGVSISPRVSETLVKIIRDNTWHANIRKFALDALVLDSKIDCKVPTLKPLLEDVHSGCILDPDNELQGTLLLRLYPRHLSPEKLWKYLTDSGNLELFGRYWRFWEVELFNLSNTEDFPDLIHSLQGSLTAARKVLSLRHLAHIPLKLLSVSLAAHGDRLDIAQLYDWLGIGLPVGLGNYGVGDERYLYQIRTWISKRPEVYKNLFLEGLYRCHKSDDFEGCVFKTSRHLYSATWPSDFGIWCLEKAIDLRRSHARISEHLLRHAVWAQKNELGNAGLSEPIIRKRVARYSKLRAIANLLLDSGSAPSSNLDRRLSAVEHIAEQRVYEDPWLERIRHNEPQLKVNRGEALLLHELAERYFGLTFSHFDQRQNLDKLLGFLGNNQHLLDVVSSAFIDTIRRDDVPDPKAILRLHKEGKMSYFCLPYLAGIEGLWKEKGIELFRLDTQDIEKAVVFYFCTPHGVYRPQWYRFLLSSRPELVADIQIRFARCEFATKSKHIYKIWELANDREHALVAQLASLHLLKSFPTRCRLHQIKALDQLLWAAYQYSDRDAFCELIQQKLSRKSIQFVQRAHWLLIGLIVSPKRYARSLYELVSKRRYLARSILDFFHENDDKELILESLEPLGLEQLIRIIGENFEPFLTTKDELDSDEDRASIVFERCLNLLVLSVEDSVGYVLEKLARDPRLVNWHNRLIVARELQRRNRRDLCYANPTVNEIIQVLSGGSAVSSADLAALVLDRLREIDGRIRTTNTDDWRQYWNLDRWGRPRKDDRRDENSCRDALLSDLRLVLPDGIDAQPEGQHSGAARSDIRVSCGRFVVPVEIKKSTHRELWSALRSQLLAKYVMDPAADGYGIYVVLWLGSEDVQPNGDGHCPSDAKELERLLLESLSEQESKKISCCVIDVSPRVVPTPRRTADRR